MKKLLLLSLITGLYSCTSTPVNMVEDKDFQWDRVFSAAVIPFQSNFEKNTFSAEEQESISKHLNKEFYRSFAPLSFDDLEPRFIEQYLQKNKLSSKELTNSKSNMKKLGLDLGIDLIISAKVKDYSYTSLLLHERWHAAMELSIFECSTGKLIWKYAHEQSRQELHTPTSPEALASKVIEVLMRDKQMDLLVQRLCRELADSIPQAQTNDTPKIRNISFSPQNFLKRGDKVTVSIYGSPGMKAFFKIGKNTESIATVEKPRGVYTGEYRINETIEGEALKLQASIQNRINESTPWMESKFPINIDQIPPPTTKFSLHTHNKSIKISWHQPEEKVPYYIIFRRSTLEKYFIELSSTNDTHFTDKAIQANIRYYYKVYAVDRAGNIAKDAEVHSAYYCPPGPTVLNNLPQELFSEGSPYILQKDLVLEKGQTLIIAAGTEMNLKSGNLKIKGTLIAKGTKSKLCLFSTSNSEQDALKFIGGKGEILNCTFNGFKNAITAQDSRLNITSSKISRSANALSLKKDSRTHLEKIIFSDCQRAILIEPKNYIKLERCLFNRNQINLQFNADSTVEAEDNFWGEVPHSFNTKNIKVNGPLKVEHILTESDSASSPLAISALAEYILYRDAKSKIRKFQACKQLLKKDKDFKNAYQWKAEYLINTLQFEEAKQIINEATERFKNDSNFTQQLHKLKSNIAN